jgi:hypothetical protein
VKLDNQYLKFVGDPLTDDFMDEVQEWTKQTNCGLRMSFDMFKFKNKKHMTMFLLRWA